MHSRWTFPLKICSTGAIEHWSLSLFCLPGAEGKHNVICLFGLTLLFLSRVDRQAHRAPGRVTGGLRNAVLKNKVIHRSAEVLLSEPAHKHLGRHSDVFTTAARWMQIECDRSRAMIVRIAGAAQLQSDPAVYSHSPHLPSLISKEMPHAEPHPSCFTETSLFNIVWRIRISLNPDSWERDEKWKSNVSPCDYSLMRLVWWASRDEALAGSCSVSVTTRTLHVQGLDYPVSSFNVLVYKSNEYITFWKYSRILQKVSMTGQWQLKKYCTVIEYFKIMTHFFIPVCCICLKQNGVRRGLVFM